ncbi:MAG TPA: carboxypeptidase-like regulatory domain-containing protein [Terriglobales bacterium]|nr:carboxypeptidase-like regulatory domain-containing protein [Terriglobales bacterium]
MSVKKMRTSLSFAILLFVLAAMSQVWAQTTTTGDISGVVTDPTGAVIPNASVTLKNIDTGGSQSATTNAQGSYRFALLSPGNYSVTANATGFQPVTQRVSVALGSSASGNLQLSLSSSSTTVEVSGQTTAVETDNANLNTNFSPEQVALLPNPGNDISAVALTSPGAVMNTAGGSTFGGGNFELYGLPATSNLFTVDGSNYNDPYFNINNSGATNLSLGLNDVQESAVVANGYSGSYGGLAGANINYVTKSGSNAFHGNAEYWWNGRVMDANNYFRNQANALAGSDVSPRPFVNANQWAGSIGGPIKKDKAFFFFDYEGLRLLIPSPTTVNLPTAAFENAVLANLGTSGLTASVPYYQHLFNLYNGVSQAGASALPGGTDANNNVISAAGCSNVTPALGAAFAAFGPGGTPCAVKIQGGLSAATHDVLYAGRFDENIGNNDKLFVRVEHEHGLQASYIDPINANFNAISDQPQWQSNFGETHTFGSSKVNNFNASLLWYSAVFTFANPTAQASTLGASIFLGDNSLTALGGIDFNFPQGRNITQYQFVDDFSWVHGRHSFKVGANFRRDDVTDKTPGIFTSPQIVEFSLADLALGGTGAVGSRIQQTFPTRLEYPIALYQLGIYGADDIRVTSNLKLTLSLRLDHLSNPVCQVDCFQRLAAPFDQLNKTAAINQQVLGNQHQAFPGVTGIAAQPKIGFAWTPFGAKNTVVRGGFGVFADALPTGAIDSILDQAPSVPFFAQFNGTLAPQEVNSLNSIAAAANAGFKTDFASGSPNTPPFSFFNPTKTAVPRYYEWSLELQQQVGWKTTLSAMYVGNHGSHEEFVNQAVNAFCCIANQFGTGSTQTHFADLPTTVPDAALGQVSQQQNVANSNYSGLVVTARHNFSGGFQFQASYTYSHAQDEISNNTFSPFGVNIGGQQADIIYPQDPFNFRKYNYGNADYDIRHNFVMNYVWSDAFRHLTSHGPNVLVKGWTFSGTIFRHSGLPFTVFSNNDTNALSSTNFGSGLTYIYSNIVGATGFNCSGQAAKVNNPCLLTSNFADPFDTFGNQGRNQFRGPGYFDTDFAVEKGFGIPKWEGAQFSIGARFFNIFNHPNFNFPIENANSSQFGQITSTISTPTSIYGSGLGADASPRLIQIQGKITF